LNVCRYLIAGLVAENIMLLAVKYGWGRLRPSRLPSIPDVLRKVLGIPDSKVIVIGIAIGYPDWDHPLNNMYSERASLDTVARWHGFD